MSLAYRLPSWSRSTELAVVADDVASETLLLPVQTLLACNSQIVAILEPAHIHLGKASFIVVNLQVVYLRIQEIVIDRLRLAFVVSPTNHRRLCTRNHVRVVVVASTVD